MTFYGFSGALCGNIIYLNTPEGPPLEIVFERSDRDWIWLHYCQHLHVTVDGAKVVDGESKGFKRVLASDCVILIDEKISI
jgi:hypothetical protein